MTELDEHIVARFLTEKSNFLMNVPKTNQMSNVRER